MIFSERVWYCPATDQIAVTQVRSDGLIIQFNNFEIEYAAEKYINKTMEIEAEWMAEYVRVGRL